MVHPVKYLLLAKDVYKKAILFYNHRWYDQFFLAEMQFTIHQQRESDGPPGKVTPLLTTFQDQRSSLLYSLQRDRSLRSQPPSQQYQKLPLYQLAPACNCSRKDFHVPSHSIFTMPEKRHVSCAVKWVIKPQNVPLMPMSSCCGSANSLILTTNQDWQGSIEGLITEAMTQEVQNHKI